MRSIALALGLVLAVAPVVQGEPLTRTVPSADPAPTMVQVPRSHPQAPLPMHLEWVQVKGTTSSADAVAVQQVSATTVLAVIGGVVVIVALVALFN